jgi:flagellar basal body-associated protein FliL
MSAFFGDVASAALPVAVALLITAAAACGVLWVEVENAQAQRQARLYLEPLSTWCLIALAVYVMAHIAAGGGLLILFLPLGLAVLAGLLRSADETDEPVEEQQPAPPTAATAPAPASTLWARPPIG